VQGSGFADGAIPVRSTLLADQQPLSLLDCKKRGVMPIYAQEHFEG